jgi:hypothetical protein
MKKHPNIRAGRIRQIISIFVVIIAKDVMDPLHEVVLWAWLVVVCVSTVTP